jgi:prolyl oligopeptidase
MHALGWTRQQAIDFLKAHSALGENNIVNEVDRYIVWPGQALAYKIGQLEILRLRAEAKARLGDAFDIKDFHDTVLGAGAISLPALRGRIEEWLAS